MVYEIQANPTLIARMAAIPEPVKKCVAILKAAETDTEKLAALFMVTKLVKANECSAAVRKILFEAIGFKFLKRLLLTPDVQDCPPQVYQSVALSILSAFCKDPELVIHPELLSNLQMFLDIVQTSDAADDDNLIIVNEAYECLQGIAASKPGLKALFDIGAVSKMAEIYSHQSFQTDEALDLLVTLVTGFGPACWEGTPGSFHTIMNKISLDCETDQSERKFHLCDVMNALLTSCKQDTALNFGEDTTWPASVYKCLYDILTSKIGKAQRDPALKLASAMTSLMGPKWTMMDEDNPRKFFLLLVQLACVEVRMQLEDKGGLKGAMNNADLITACFLLIETAITFVANEDVELEGREKQSLYTAMKGGFSAVISLLMKVQNDINRKKLQLELKEKAFICAMVRVLSSWMAQETSAMRDQIYQLLPFMLNLANETFYAYRARYMMEKVRGPPGGSNPTGEPMEVDTDPLSQVDILRFMLPALCHLAVEEQARKILLDTKEDEILYESFAFHWSIVHYKKPPVPRADRLKVRKEEALDPKLVEDMKDSRTAMISICNIFMNITVLEAKIVEESSLFAQLLKFIFNNLPELRNVPDNLVLHGNMAVLGLLLLKQQAKKIKKNDFSICRYIQATIRFLWDAYNVDESNDSTTLVVAMDYKEHWIQLMELWFLGMQTMSAVISLIPWISEFAMETGWAEGIIDTLKKVKYGSLPPNTKSAYEDFLCHLVEANNSVASVLKKRDALAVCRNHRLMELGKKLFED